MLIRVDPTSKASLADQVAAQVRRGVSDGSIAVGERLPAARELAAALGINMHTVLRAYDLLRIDGLIELRRGRGAVVIDNSAHHTLALREAAAELVAAAVRLGVTRTELATMIEEMP
jgi:GntR family transcriptional regulator